MKSLLDPFQKCLWANDQSLVDPDGSGAQNPLLITKLCSTKWCPAGKLDVAKAKVPETLSILLKQSNFCSDWTSLPGSPPDYSLCCDPPVNFDRNWPIVPAYLWSHYDNDSDADVTWTWANNFGNNDAESMPHDLDDDPGADPFGFVMLDGTPGSIHKAFSKDFTVVQRSEPPRMFRRSSPLTTNRTIIDSVFEHKEETIQVYCNHAHDSPQCRRIFYKGAEDTIIRLPAHIGEGPWARIVSMEPELDSEDPLPDWVLKKRSQADNKNGEP
jgi:chitinase